MPDSTETVPNIVSLSRFVKDPDRYIEMVRRGATFYIVDRLAGGKWLPHATLVPLNDDGLQEAMAASIAAAEADIAEHGGSDPGVYVGTNALTGEALFFDPSKLAR